MAKQLIQTSLGLSGLGVASVLLAIGLSGGCATGAADGFGGAGGAGNSTNGATSTKSASGTVGSTTGATSTKASSGSGGVCGNGVCSQDESCQTCPADCTCSAVCGNGTCDTGETCDACPADCPTGCTSGSSMSTSSGTSGCNPCMTGMIDLMSCIMDPNFQTIFAVCLADSACCDTAWDQGCIDAYEIAGGSCP